ncbi:hypothetical protein M0R45_034582 [Rubus argutus]|uniref:Uncharacterized protein n=1 Tax=Rubus argutus TaxID=59490 RepID=A0AAW1VU58_RUBAR
MKSRGDTIIIAEESRSKRFQIGIGLGCAVWLIYQLRKSLEVEKGRICGKCATSFSTTIEEFRDTWGCVVVCEKQTVFQSWKIINRCLSSWLHREVDLLPYQNNRAFFVCKNYEEAKRIANHSKIPLKGQPEVLLLNGWMA